MYVSGFASTAPLVKTISLSQLKCKLGKIIQNIFKMKSAGYQKKKKIFNVHRYNTRGCSIQIQKFMEEICANRAINYYLQDDFSPIDTPRHD